MDDLLMSPSLASIFLISRVSPNTIAIFAAVTAHKHFFFLKKRLGSFGHTLQRPGVASDGSKGGNSLDAVTPGLTLGTLYSSGVGINKTKQHQPKAAGSKV